MQRSRIMDYGCVKWIIVVAAALFTNAQGHGPSSGTLKMSVEPRDEVVAAGREVTLQCSSPGAAVRWRHSTNSTPTREHTISDSDAHRKQHPNGSLTVSVAFRDLAGYYQCVASVDGVGTIVSRAALLIIAEPPLLSGARDVAAVRGAVAVVPCGMLPPARAALALAPPPPRARRHRKGHVPPTLDVTISWYKDGVVVPLDSRTSLTPTGGLELDPAAPHDAGTYVCKVSVIGNLSATSGPIQVRVVEEPDEVEYPPRFVTTPQSLTVIEGAPVAFDCAAAGNPRPEVTWLHNGLPIDFKSLDAGWTGGAGWARGEAGAGTVTCRAAADGHVISHSATVTVNSPPTVSAGGRVSAAAGGVAVLRCGAGGRPPPQVVWYKDGDALTLTHDVTLVEQWSLRISGVLKEDSGMFQCVASSAVGSAAAAIRLRVTAPDTDHRTNTTLKKSKRKKSKLKNKNINTKPFLNSLVTDLVTDLERSKVATTTTPNPHHDIFNSLVSDEKSDVFQYPDGTDFLGETSSAYSSYPEIYDYDSPENTSFNSTSNNSLDPGQNVDNSLIFHAPEGFDLSSLRSRNTSSVPPPRGLKAVLVRHMFVTLSWEPPESAAEEITGYAIICKVKGSQRERVSWSAAGRHETTVPGLSPNTTYQFTARTVTAHGVSAPAPWVEVVSSGLEAVWGPVQGLSGRATASSISLSWKPPPNANEPLNYRIDTTHVESGKSTSVWTEVGATRWEVGGVGGGGTYRLVVTAAGGLPSPPLTLRAPDSRPLTPPANVTVTTHSDTSLTVSWTSAEGGEVTGYRVRFRAGGAGRGRGRADSVTTPPDVTTVLLTDLQPQTDYQVGVSAMSSSGAGPMSEWVSASTGAPGPDTDARVPDAPPPLTTRAGRDWISVWWGGVSRGTRGWEVGWGRGVPDDHTAPLPAHARSHLIKDLVPNSEYVISLRASNSLGLGPAVYATVRTKPAAGPDDLGDLDDLDDIDDTDDEDLEDDHDQEEVLITPLGLKAIMMSGTTAVVYWTDPTLSKDQPVSDGRRYVVRYAAVDGGAGAGAGAGRPRFLNVSDLSCMIDDLTPYTDYEFTVKLIKDGRSSPWSLVLVNRTLPAPPASPPRHVRLTDVSAGALSLSWTPPHDQHSPITGYVIMYAAVGQTRPAPESVPWSTVEVGPRREARLDRLRPATRYYLRVQARTAAGLGPATPVVEATTLSESGGGLAAATSAWLWASAGGAVAVLTLAAVLALSLCCRRRHTPPLHDTSTYQKSSASTGIKPPDLWIHHDQMELKHMDKNMHNSHISSGSVEGGGLMSSTLTLPRPLDYSLDRRIHVPTYVDSRWSASVAGGSDSDETAVLRHTSHSATSATSATRDCTPMTGAGCGAGCGADRRPPHTLPRHHDQSTPLLAPPPLSSPPSSLASLSHHPHSCGAGVCGDVYAAVGRERGHYVAYEPLSHYAHRESGPREPAYSTGGRHSAAGGAVAASQLHSFNNDPHSAHSTPSHGKGSVRETSPYKKSASSSPGHTRLALGLAPELEPLTPSRSTERLHQEMENLHGLMKDLSAITHHQYDC